MKKRQLHTGKKRTYRTYPLLVRFLCVCILVTQFLVPIAPAFAQESTDTTPPSTVDMMSQEVRAEGDTPPQSASTATHEDTDSVPPTDELPVPTIDDDTSLSDTEDGVILSQEAITDSPTSSTSGASVQDTHNDSDESVLPTQTPHLLAEEALSTTTEVSVSSTSPPTMLPGEDTDGTTTVDTTPPQEVPGDIGTTSLPSNDEVVLVPEEGVPLEDATTSLPIEETPTTTTALTPSTTVIEAHSVTTDENRFAFGVDECTRVADGSYYCREERSTSTPKREKDGVMAGPDQDGDNEIFITKDGTTVQLTFNQLDDTAPVYDPLSETIVWHRLIDGRYQIMEYDIEKGEEHQLTHDSFNNMQPTRSGDITAWQGWVGNDWEIFMRHDSEITMLTDNVTHDIGPEIHDNHIIWQSHESGEPIVLVYDIDSKHTERIEGSEGESVMNPRVVLVYDTEDENGDSKTVGYDLKTGKREALTRIPVEIPSELPDPDQTGEKRALVTIVTGGKSKTSEDDDDGDDALGSTTPVFLPPDDTGTSTVVVPPLEEASLTVGDITDTGSFDQSTSTESNIHDVVLAPLQDSAPANIEDLVIPPFLDDSQTVVAETE